MSGHGSSRGIAAIVGVGPKLGRSLWEIGVESTLQGNFNLRECTRGGSSSVKDESISSWENEGTMDPDAVAQTYWHLHIQDRTAWTHNTATFF
ncbi:hypothetical protein VNO78_08203 [Psophocarpus tetragonolobus]|uniref:Uncharacterized protein n=1 Tax=Psophocarpus tetragonolobus TaxID=3891 RepID=A0AAN9SVM2_PSOTE